MITSVPTLPPPPPTPCGATIGAALGSLYITETEHYHLEFVLILPYITGNLVSVKRSAENIC